MSVEEVGKTFVLMVDDAGTMHGSWNPEAVSCDKALLEEYGKNYGGFGWKIIEAVVLTKGKP